MILASFYTDLKSKVHAQALADSARALGIVGLEVDVEGLPGENGDRTRAEFIRRMLNKWPKQDVLYVEAGGLVRQPPSVFFEVPCPFDVAAYVHRLSGPAPTRVGRFDGIGWIFPYTLFFAQNEKSRKVLDRWVESNAAHPKRTEMENLLYFLAEEPVRVLYLNPEYAWVERTMRPFYPDARPIIEHLAPIVPGAPDRLAAADRPPVSTFRAFAGLGDTFYMRPAVRRLAQRDGVIHVVSPWPQLFWDMPGVRVLRPPVVSLRAQAENVERTEPGVWAGAFTDGQPSRLLEYSLDDFRAGRTAIDAFLERAGVVGKPVQPEEFRFRVPESWIEEAMRDFPRPFGIVHPPTIRKEWPNSSRNPRMEYLQEIVRETAPYVHWISVARVRNGDERFDGPDLQGVSRKFDRGELSLEALVGLVSIADFVLTGPCFLLPLAAAVGTPAFTIWGGSVPPRLLIDSDVMRRVWVIAPEPFCSCYEQSHDCNKLLNRDLFFHGFNKFIRELHL